MAAHLERSRVARVIAEVSYSFWFDWSKSFRFLGALESCSQNCTPATIGERAEPAPGPQLAALAACIEMHRSVNALQEAVVPVIHAQSAMMEQESHERTRHVRARARRRVLSGRYPGLPGFSRLCFLRGQSPESITQSFAPLSLEQVYGAITFYLANEGAVDEYLKQGRENLERIAPAGEGTECAASCETRSREARIAESPLMKIRFQADWDREPSVDFQDRC